MRNRITMGMAAVLCLSGASARAEEGWKFSVGPSYVGGLQDVRSFYIDAMEREGYTTTDSANIPIGVGFTAYYAWKHGSRFCLDCGPMSMVTASGDTSKNYFDLPVGVSYGYAFLPAADSTPYVRVGVRTHLASGSYVDHATPGLFAAIGVDFNRHRRVSMGLEVGVDTSTVTLQQSAYYNGNPINVTQDVKPGSILVNFHVNF